jgi:hypothetical protein
VVWLDTRSVTASPDWPKPVLDELAEVPVDGVKRRCSRAEAMPEPPLALIPPPRDAFVLGGRAFLMPNAWRPRRCGSPGVAMVDGGVAGIWRTRHSEPEAAVPQQGEIVATGPWSHGEDGGGVGGLTEQ